MVSPAKDGPSKPVATNRNARRNYELLETLECGLALQGSEVKSLRTAKAQINDGYVRIRDDELWLHGLHISPYSHSSAATGHETERPRKLLAHRSQIDHLRERVDQERLALVALTVYFLDGRAKVDIALARGRKTHDKRQALAKRDAEMEARRAMSRANRRPG